MTTTNRNSFESLNRAVGFDVAATLKANQRDCRLGHCGHRECEEAADRRFAASGLGIDETDGDETPVSDELFQMGLEMLDEYRKDCKRGICHHSACHHKVERRIAAANRRPRATVGNFPKVYPLTADGRIDKKALREQIHFGTC